MEKELSFGEYVRRLRKDAHVSLYDLANKTGLAYTHLSRLENDSTIPGPESVVKIAEALDGDLKLMLERAACLPRAILDRIANRALNENVTALPRAAYGNGGGSSGELPKDLGPQTIANEAEDMAEAISLLPKMQPHHRRAVVDLIRALYHEGDEPTG